jgi:hypothetical protein
VSYQLDLPAANAFLKEWYDAQKVQNLAYAKNPFFAMVPKDEEVGGKYYPQPIQFEVNQGRSATFSNAQGNQSAAQFAEFLVTYKRDYDIATIDNLTLESAMTSTGAFKNAATVLIDSAIRGCTISQASALFRSGTGTIGQISGSVSSGVITLTNPADVSQFGVNQTLQANTTDGGASPRAALGYVVARNGAATAPSLSPPPPRAAAPATPTGWSCVTTTSSCRATYNAKPSGLAAWLPLTDPHLAVSDNFYGVNRSGRLPPLRRSATTAAGQPIEEAAHRPHHAAWPRGRAAPAHFATNYGSYAALVKALGTRREYEDMQGPGGPGLPQPSSSTAPTGPLKCFSGQKLPGPATGYVLHDGHLEKACSLGAGAENPQVPRTGSEMLRVYNSGRRGGPHCRLLKPCLQRPWLQRPARSLRLSPEGHKWPTGLFKRSSSLSLSARWTSTPLLT